jgi:pimeloyl-ACP methyl ester carboxylesterase
MGMELYLMKRKILTALAAVVLPAFGVTLTGSPALADCPSNTFCLYETNGYAGTEFQFWPSTSCSNFVSGINNDANAMRNYRNAYIKMWDLPGCGGSTTYTAQPYSYDSDFGNNGFSNKGSSLKRI